MKKNNQDLVVSLIKDDLTNLKLVGGLNDLGITADDYFLSLPDTIFDLVGIKEEQVSSLKDKYHKISLSVKKIDISDEESLEEIAMDIYGLLLDFGEN